MVRRTVARRDPRTAWCAHRSVRVGAIFFNSLDAGSEVSKFSGVVRILARAGSGVWIPGCMFVYF